VEEEEIVCQKDCGDLKSYNVSCHSHIGPPYSLNIGNSEIADAEQMKILGVFTPNLSWKNMFNKPSVNATVCHTY